MHMRLINQIYKNDRSFVALLRNIRKINFNRFSLIEAIKILLGH
jgi:hypothetical protein